MSSVLIVDDDPSTCETFTHILRLAGHRASSVTTGGMGLNLASTRPFDLVLADLRLPDMSGVDVLRELTRAGVHAPFVIMTAYGSTTTAVEAMKLGAGNYVEKPLSDDDLLEIVRCYAYRRAEGPSDRRPIDCAPSAPAERRVLATMKIIKERYHEHDLSLKSVACRLGVTSEHLCRLIRRHTGRTFLDHLLGHRVAHAQRLLRETTLSMKEVAGRAGFETTSQFDHHFRRMRGKSPSSYRHSAMQPNVTASR